MGEGRQKYLVRGICILLAVVTFFAYVRVLKNDFINYDDNEYVTENPHIFDGLKTDGIKWAFTTTSIGYWHPLTFISHMLDCELFGLRPWGHHLVNLLLHIANVLLLFSVLRWMTGVVWRSAFVAAVFAVHPLNVESVAWIAERKNVLSTMFWLLTIGSYWKYSKERNAGWYLLTLLLFAMGLMSKPMVMTLPFTLLLLDYWPLNRYGKNLILLILEKVPFVILSIASGVITYIGQKYSGAVADVRSMTLWYRVGNAIISYSKYIGKMFWPTKLAVLYPLEKDILLWKVIISAAVLAAICILVIIFIRRCKYLTVGWLWYLGTLVPVIGIVQVGNQAMADRYAYLPLIGLFIMAAWGI